MTDASDDLVLTFTPPLVTLLLSAERAAGRPLTEEEVLEIRDAATCVALPAAAATAMTASRGYPDLDPEHCWAQWQQVRGELAKDRTD